MKQLKIAQSVTNRSEIIEKYFRDVNSKPMISLDEEVELALKIKEGDEEAFQKLVEGNLRFVISVAKRYQCNELDLCDLINEGNIGLMVAARKFDPTRGIKFISYAVWWIRQQIMEAISNKSKMVKLPSNQVVLTSKINKVINEFILHNEREPSNSEIANIMDIGIDKVNNITSSTSKCISLDRPFGEEEDGTLLDILPDNNCEPADSFYNKESLKKDLCDAIAILNPRQQEIIRKIYGIGCSEMTLEEIGEEMGLTKERVRQIREKAIKILQYSDSKKILRKYR